MKCAQADFIYLVCSDWPLKWWCFHVTV